MKKGLILEGGAMRGMFTAGVTDVMMEHGIEFDGLIGVSAGAVFGCNYKSKQPGRTIRYNKKYCKNPKYCSLRSLIFTGDLYGADFCYHEIPTKLDVFDEETFCKNPMEFYVTCTDVVTGQAVYHKCERSDNKDLLWFRASASMPLVSRIVEAEGYQLLDGGIADSVPLRHFESLGYDKNVVILTQPKEYVKQKNRLLPVMKIVLRKYPALVEAMARRHEVYNETLAYIKEQEAAGKVFVIRPEEKLPIGHIERDPEMLQKVYELGRTVGEKQIGAIEDFLRG
ncbi:MAG: patatin family protein [Ruminococcaceae bacterium]|nr:patatin family protein [Oscillospiraceae bacterium]